MSEINNIEIYNQRMAAGMEDKTWFVDKVCNDVRVVVDYGCADGTLLSLIHYLHPDLVLIGVDNNDKMLKLAKYNVPSALFYTVGQFRDIRFNFGNAVLILSSVVHEIFSYDKDPTSTMNVLFGKGFKYIAIRDMMISSDISNPISDRSDIIKVSLKADQKMLQKFESIHGNIRNKKNLIHFLMKYKYVENWNREVRENYLPYDLENFLREIIPNTYQVEYLEHYTLPYLKKIVKEDFGIELKDKTHLKLLLKKE